MKKNHLLIHAFFLLIYVFLLNTNSFAEPANLGLLKNTVRAYHDSGAYHKELSASIAQARDFIVRRAIANAQSAHPKKLALVLDIDETSLSNYKHMLANGFGGTKKKWHCENLAADATVIKPMLKLYNEALKHKITVFFITGRTEDLRQPTKKNLTLAGYRHWAKLYLKPNDYHQASVIPFKSQTRAAIAKQGYTVIASIGDQESDLKGGYAEKTFKLPNPYYFIP